MSSPTRRQLWAMGHESLFGWCLTFAHPTSKQSRFGVTKLSCIERRSCDIRWRRSLPPGMRMFARRFDCGRYVLSPVPQRLLAPNVFQVLFRIRIREAFLPGTLDGSLHVELGSIEIAAQPQNAA
jgi:hypothetical protein